MVICPKCKETLTGIHFTMNKKRTKVFYKCPCSYKWNRKINWTKKERG